MNLWGGNIFNHHQFFCYAQKIRCHLLRFVTQMSHMSPINYKSPLFPTKNQHFSNIKHIKISEFSSDDFPKTVGSRKPFKSLLVPFQCHKPHQVRKKLWKRSRDIQQSVLLREGAINFYHTTMPAATNCPLPSKLRSLIWVFYGAFTRHAS